MGIALCPTLALAVFKDCEGDGYNFQKSKILYQVQETKKMGEKNENRIKVLLEDVDKEFQRLTPYLQAKFAIEQISVWQRKFNMAKNNILEDDVVDATTERNIIGQDAEIDS